MISGGQFVARLAEYFGLLTKQRLHGLTVIVRELPVIDMDELAVPAPVQAPQLPPAAGLDRSLPQRVARLKEEVHGMRGALGEQIEVLECMACEFSRFPTWTVTSLSHMMDRVGVRYTSYSDYQIPYVRCTGHRTNDVSTLAPQQPEP
nr:hypothetical protein [Tanacetum cinerariifolium]